MKQSDKILLAEIRNRHKNSHAASNMEDLVMNSILEIEAKRAALKKKYQHILVYAILTLAITFGISIYGDRGINIEESNFWIKRTPINGDNLITLLTLIAVIANLFIYSSISSLHRLKKKEPFIS